MTKLPHKTRALNGILLLNKPTGMSSNAALQIVKRLYNARKAGHTGSLDPLASGMLPLCFGEATKFSQYLLEADKHYLVTATLGVTTSTGDREGNIVAQQAVPPLSSQTFEKLFQSFTGIIEQVPSMFSALKHQGQPLYKLARQGIEVERKPRNITVHSLQLQDYQENSFSFKVHCSKGTYVRTLVEDMGHSLGCGAHVSNLHRIGAGPYQVEQMQTLAHLEQLKEANDIETMDSYLLPVDSSISTWPKLELSEAAIYYLKRGQAIIPPINIPTGWVRLIRRSGSFFGVGEALENGWIEPRRLVEQ